MTNNRARLVDNQRLRAKIKEKKLLTFLKKKIQQSLVALVHAIKIPNRNHGGRVLFLQIFKTSDYSHLIKSLYSELTQS